MSLDTSNLVCVCVCVCGCGLGVGVAWVWSGWSKCGVGVILPVLKSITCCLLHLPLFPHTGPGGKAPKDDERLRRVPQEEGRGAKVEKEIVFGG